MEIDKESGMWGIACSYAYDEAKAKGMRRGGIPMYNYVTKRAPEIYEQLENKTYKFGK
jgi:hypothetical protein